MGTIVHSEANWALVRDEAWLSRKLGTSWRGITFPAALQMCRCLRALRLLGRVLQRQSSARVRGVTLRWQAA